MQSTTRTAFIAGCVGLVIGLVLGFWPAHLSANELKAQNQTLTDAKTDLQNRYSDNQNKLRLSTFAVRSAQLVSEAGANNYSVASTEASSLFTDLRSYVESHPPDDTTQQLREVLSVRDKAIGGLAQAEPGVRPLLQQIFNKLSGLTAAASPAH